MQNDNVKFQNGNLSFRISKIVFKAKIGFERLPARHSPFDEQAMAGGKPEFPE